MYGMNFLFGNNFRFGGFGCCCRPMVNPFMLGAMQGYTSAMCAYSMMGNIFQTPSVMNFYMPGQYQNIYAYNYNNVLSQSLIGSQPSFSINDMLSSSQEALQNLQNTLSLQDNAESNSFDSSNAAQSQSSGGKGEELKANPDFMYKIQKVAKSLNCDPNDLLSVMNAESGLDASALNKSGKGAVGLIQFTDIAIKELNNHGVPVTKEQLKSMDAVKQLDYVEKYLQIAKKYSFSSDARLSAADLYAINFLPGRANREVLTTKGEKYYDWNPGLDINKDGQITKSELSQRIDNFRVSLVA